MADDFQGTAPELPTPRLSLRPLQADDAGDIFAFGSDEEVTRYVFWPRHQTIEHSRGYVAWLRGPKFLTWAIRRQSDPKVIGTVFLPSYQSYHRKAELAFNLSRSCWGQGYATEAGSPILRHALGPLGLHRIEGTCMVANGAPARVLAKLGMRYEGLLRESRQRGDCFFDMKLFAILSTDLP